MSNCPVCLQLADQLYLLCRISEPLESRDAAVQKKAAENVLTNGKALIQNLEEHLSEKEEEITLAHTTTDQKKSNWRHLPSRTPTTIKISPSNFNPSQD